MKVGDYVRTENGEIGTIIDCPEQLKKDYGKWLWFETTEEQRPIRREQIDKSSPNIIDLIEVGDYVNGKKVIKIWEEPFGEFAGQIFTILDGEATAPTIREIKSIVTKEQFENIEYKIGE